MMFSITRRLIVNFLQGAVLVVLIVAAGYVSVGRILVANIGKFRHEIEKSLAGRLHIGVHIGKISGGWLYLDPRISIDHLVIGVPRRPAVKIGHLAARIDTLASIRTRTLVLHSLDVDGLTLTVSQNGLGSWRIEGMPPATGKRRPFNAGPLLDSIRYVQGIDIRGLDVEVNARHRRYHIANQSGKPLELAEEGVQKTLDMPLAVSHEGGASTSEFELLGRYSGDPRDLNHFSANLYLRLPQVELADFLPDTVGGVKLNRVGLRGQLWLDCNRGKFELRGLPIVNEFSITRDGKRIVLVRDFSAMIAAGTWAPGEWQVRVSNVKADLGGQAWHASAVDVALHSTDKGLSWAARFPDLSLGELSRIGTTIGRSAGLVSARGLQAIRSIRPGGRLADVMVESEAGGDAGPKLVARLDGVHIDAWRGSPAISSINGLAVLTPTHGYIDVHNKAFKLDFATMFDEPWTLDSASARLYYTYRPGLVQVNSGLIELKDGGMKADGRVHLNLPADPALRTWGLEIGILDADLHDVHKYLPLTLSENLHAWLNRAIKGGVAVQSGLLFHGAMGKDTDRTAKTVELYFKVANATLDYDPHWPELEDMFATVYIGDWGVASDDARGKIYDARIDDGHISIPVVGDAPADSILIDASVKGSLVDGIKVMTRTPVAKATDDVAKNWIGSGDMTGTLKLNIPIGPRAGRQAGVDVNLHLPGDNIMMSDYNLDVLDLDGSFRYRSDAGLSSPKFTALLLNRPVTGRIETHKGEHGGAIEIHVDGKVAMKDLYAWSGQMILSRTAGVTGYKAVLAIPFGADAKDDGYVEAHSDLAGVRIDLPPPMEKPADTRKPLVYRQTFLKPGYKVDLTLGDKTRASLKTLDGIVRGGEIAFGDSPLGKVTYDKLRVTGKLGYVDYGQWQKATRYFESKSAVSLQSAAASTLDYIDVSVAKLHAFGMSQDNVAVHITRGKSAWNVHLRNAMVSGLIKVPDTDKAPLDVALDYYRFASPKTGAKGGAATDPLAGVDPSGFVPFDFTTRELNYNGQDYGDWTFKYRPQAGGGLLEDVNAHVKGLGIVDSTVTWDAKAKETKFVGTINVKNLSKALKAWGFASSIDGSDFAFKADVAWPGSPAMVDLYTMKGMVDIEHGQGRFVQAEGGGPFKLLGIFDFASLAKRFRLDFSDIVKKGYSFRKINGSARLDEGRLSVVSPIVITGFSSTLKLGGSADLKTGKLDNDMIITLPVARNLPWYAAYSAIASGPLAGAGVWLAQKIFGHQINQMSSAKYKISGTIDKPNVAFVSIFSDKVRETSPAPQPSTKPAATSGHSGKG